MTNDRPGTIVVGVDGAGFDLLGPLVASGELPTMKRIVEDGVSGPLESVLTPVTSPNWSGVNKRDGLFAAVSPAFGSGSVEGLSILDLTPTLLAVHDRPVPADMDGWVREEVLAEGAPTGTRRADAG